MNEQTGPFPGAALALVDGAAPPALAGLREIAVTRAAKQDRFDLNAMWAIVSKWWWLIAAITVACLLAAIVLSLLITPLYRAKAVIEVNPEGVQVVEMGKLEPMRGFNADQDFLTTQVGLIRSRSLAERVARSLNLASDPKIVSQQAPLSTRQVAAASTVLGSLTVEQERDSRLLTLVVQSVDPSLAAKIANAYADIFIQSNLERRFEATSYARNFLENRIRQVRAKLEETERALVAYAQQNRIITLNVDQSNGTGQRNEQSIDAASLIQLNEALSRAKAERIATEQAYRQGNAKASADVIANPTVQALSEQRAQLEAQYQEKLSVYQPDFPVMVQLRNRIQSLEGEIARQSRGVSGAASSSLRAAYLAAAGRESQLQAKVNQLQTQLLGFRARSIQYTILQRDVDTNRSLYDALLQRFKEVGVAGGVGTNTISIIDKAQPPSTPFKPNLPLNIAIGLLAGLLLGFGTAFTIEWIDDTVKSPDDVKAKLGIGFLGVIPMAGKGRAVRSELEDSRSQISEAYQSVRAALQFSTDHGIPKTLLTTSTRASEGKSSTALALAQTLATLGASVLLVDADLRKPTFRGPNTGSGQGLSSLLAGAGNVRECVHQTEVERLFLLTSGPIPPNPAELLASERLREVLDEVSGMFEYVIIDGPPVLGLADAPLLASYCEGTLFVIETGLIRRAAALNAVSRLRMAGARIMGGILTKFTARRSTTGYGYGYGYGYGEGLYAYGEGGGEPKKQIQLMKAP